MIVRVLRYYGILLKRKMVPKYLKFSWRMEATAIDSIEGPYSTTKHDLIAVPQLRPGLGKTELSYYFLLLCLSNSKILRVIALMHKA